MQFPSPLGRSPSLPSPFTTPPNFGGAGGTIVLTADIVKNDAALASIFGAFAVVPGDKWSFNGSLFLSSQAAAATGILITVVSAGSSGRWAAFGPQNSTVAFQTAVNPIGTASFPFLQFDASAQFQEMKISGGLVAAAATIDPQWRINAGGTTYTILAGSWISYAKQTS